MRRTEIETAAGRFSALVWDEAPADAPWLHFAHATGMHAGLYARMLAPLAGRYRIIASDARGHGRSQGGPVGERVEWEAFAADLIAIIDAVDPGAAWLLAGHSLGGTVSLLATAMQPGRVAGLVLIDPPFIPFDIARAVLAAGSIVPNPMADAAARRRADYPDRATARAAYAGRGVFRGWSDADLDAYVCDGLRATADSVTLACAPAGSVTLACTPADRVTLACTPAWESATFRGVSHHVEAALAALARPFALIAGETGSTVPAAEYALMAGHPMCLSAERPAGTTHFVALERGDLVCAAIDRVAARAPDRG